MATQPGSLVLATPPALVGAVSVRKGTLAGSASDTYLVYEMRAWHTVLLQHVYWGSARSPDPTGSSSGYVPAQLSDILIAYVYRV